MMEKQNTPTGREAHQASRWSAPGVPTNPQDASQYWLLGGAKCGHQMGPGRAGEIKNDRAGKASDWSSGKMLGPPGRE